MTGRRGRGWVLSGVAAAVLGCVGAAGAAKAQEGGFDAFLRSPGHLERAAGSALAADAGIAPQCGQRTIDRRLDTEVLLMPRFAGSHGGLSEGSWMERWAVRRCGVTRHVNLHFTVAVSGEIRVDVAIPGDTVADPEQQAGAMQALSAFAVDELGGCGDYAVTDSAIFDSPFGGVLPQGSGEPTAWTESWTVQGCGRSEDFLVRFRPDEAASLVRIIPQ